MTGVRAQVPGCDPAQGLVLCELPVGRGGIPSDRFPQAPSPSPHHCFPLFHGGLGLGHSSPCEPTPCVEDGRHPAGWPGRLQEEGPCGIFGGCPPHTGPEHLNAMASGVTKARRSVTTLSWLRHLPRAVISSQVCSGQACSALWRRPHPAPGSQVAQPPERVCFSLRAKPGLCAGLSGRLSEVLCASHRVGLTGVVLRMWDLHFLIV